MGIVAAFMAQPDIYLLDEPSTGLDPLMRDTLIELILEQKAQGKTIFLSSHIFKELEDTCDSVLFIHDGRMVDITDRSLYEADPRETYTFTLADEEEYILCRDKVQEFIDGHPDAGIQCWRRHRHHSFTLNLPVALLNELFSLFARYTVTALGSEPFTLEKYYTTIIENVEDK